MRNLMFFIVDQLLEEAAESALLMRKTTMMLRCSEQLRREAVALHASAVLNLGEWRHLWTLGRP